MEAIGAEHFTGNSHTGHTGGPHSHLVVVDLIGSVSGILECFGERVVTDL